MTDSSHTETPASPASILDYHLLEPTWTFEQVAEGCSLARQIGLRSVVVRPCDVQLAAEWMRGSSTVLASTAGFPDGTSTTGVKLFEVRDLLRLGAKEIEWTLNPALLLSRSFQHVESELLQASEACRATGARLIVSFGSYPYADDLKIICTKIAKRVEASTISLPGMETNAALLKPLLKDVLTLKNGSFVSTFAEANALREAGWSSVATTSPGTIMTEYQAFVTLAQQS